jgi:hypothetical protein
VFALVGYLQLLSVRDRLLHAIVVLMLALCLLGLSLGQYAVVEGDQLRVAFTAYGVRLCIAFGLIVFIAFSIQHLLETREFEMLLTAPVSRTKMLLGCWLAFATVALSLSALGIIAVGALFRLESSDFVVWALTLALEAQIVTAITFVMAVILRGTTMVCLAALAFYVLGRLSGLFLGIADSPLGGSEGTGGLLVSIAMRIISIVVPRLDLFASSDWLIHGRQAGATLWLIILQAFIYIPLALAIGVADARRRVY